MGMSLKIEHCQLAMNDETAIPLTPWCRVDGNGVIANSENDVSWPTNRLISGGGWAVRWSDGWAVAMGAGICFVPLLTTLT